MRKRPAAPHREAAGRTAAMETAGHAAPRTDVPRPPLTRRPDGVDGDRTGRGAEPRGGRRCPPSILDRTPPPGEKPTAAVPLGRVLLDLGWTGAARPHLLGALPEAGRLLGDEIPASRRTSTTPVACSSRTGRVRPGRVRSLSDPRRACIRRHLERTGTPPVL